MCNFSSKLLAYLDLLAIMDGPPKGYVGPIAQIITGRSGSRTLSSLRMFISPFLAQPPARGNLFTPYRLGVSLMFWCPALPQTDRPIESQTTLSISGFIFLPLGDKTPKMLMLT